MDKMQANQLLEEWIENPNLRHHCTMVATAMQAYGEHLNLSEEEIHDWWLAGLLHDLDWEKFPDEHPNKAINDVFPNYDINSEVISAIATHAPERTGKHPESTIEKYLFACDELSGFMHAVSLMRPNGFEDMNAKSVTKKLKDKKFAEAVSRDDIRLGAEMIGKELNEHITFLIQVFAA